MLLPVRRLPFRHTIAQISFLDVTKSGIMKDEWDTHKRWVRHRDGKLLREGIGLTTGLGWSDRCENNTHCSFFFLLTRVTLYSSEDEDAPGYSPTSPSFSLTSPRQSPSFSPTSPPY